MTPHQILIDLLDQHLCRYRLIHHPPAGRSEEVALARGTVVGQGAKALVCSGITEKGATSYVLAVLPADRKLDRARLGHHLGLKKLRLADAQIASSLTGCVIGAIPPFSFHDALHLVVDPSLCERFEAIAFNAGVLDASVILNSSDYLAVARPDVCEIAADCIV